MVLRLRALAAEVTRVTLEVGSKGKLGGSAVVADVEGVWADLTINVRLAIRHFATMADAISGEPHVLQSHKSSALYCRSYYRCGKWRSPKASRN